MSKHTPGPWNVKLGSDYAVIRSDHHFRGEIAEIATTLGVRFTDEDAANARLIAAAPEMFEVLKESRHQSGCRPSKGVHTEWCQRVSAVIAKAKGTTTKEKK